MSASNIPEPEVPPRIVDPPPNEQEPVIPEPDPTHSPVLPEPEREPPRPAEPKPASADEQHQETDDAWPVMAAGPFTRAMAKGALLWGAIGAIAGFIIGALIALIPFGDLPYVTRLGIVGVACALAGATAGFVYGGGREAEVEEDVGNQIAPAPLSGKNRDPQRVREAVEAVTHDRGSKRV